MAFFEPFTGRVKHPGTSSKVTLVHPAAQVVSVAPWVQMSVPVRLLEVGSQSPYEMKIIVLTLVNQNQIARPLYIHLFQSNICLISIVFPLHL